MSKKIVAISVVAAALLGVGVWWLFNSGRLVYVAEGTETPSSVTVCGSDVVDKYNAAAYYLKRGGSETATMDEKGLKELKTSIKAKKNYENDATCQTILFWLAVNEKDAQSAESAFKAVKSLHDTHIFADSNIRSNQPLFTYENYFKGLAPSDDEAVLSE